MGRELQKRKNRSSIAKARPKKKSKKRVFNNAIVAASWDKTQTLAQNYKRLGLTAKLNKNTGGVEKSVLDLQDEHADGYRRDDPLTIVGSRRKRDVLNLREQKVERDPQTGAIVRLLDEEQEAWNPLGDPLNGLDSASESEGEAVMFDQHGHTENPLGEVEAKTAVVRQLESEAQKPERKYRRKQSEGEKQFVEQLVRKHGEDFGRMARDMKINYMQRSEGDLRKRVKRWQSEGGSIHSV